MLINRWRFGWLLSLALLAGCSDPASKLEPLPTSDMADYYLGPGDQLRIITYGDDPLTGEFRVNDSGTIALPLIGSLHAAGLSSAGLEQQVAASLERAGLIRKPSVSVEIIAYRPIFVLGEVNHPGQFPYQPGMTVVSAAAVAGGFTYRAKEDYVSIVRSVDGKTLEGKATRQDSVHPGDVVTVFERRF